MVSAFMGVQTINHTEKMQLLQLRELQFPPMIQE